MTTVQTFTLYDLVLRNAQAGGEDLAVVTESDEALGYRDLAERTDELANGLWHAGLRRGDRICVLAQNSVAFFELYLACARNGHVVYPLNWRWSVEEIERTVERAGARAFFVDDSCTDKIPAGARDDSDLVLRCHIGGGLEGWTAFDSLYSTDACTPDSVDPGNAFCVIATAAVDVIPRGAILTHGNVLASSAQQIAAMGLRASDRNLLCLPLFHIAGLGNALAILQAGGANVIMPKFDAATAVDLIDQHRITFLSDFPPVLANLLDAAQESASNLPSLRFVSGLDAPDTMERLHRETGADFWTGFGQTETSGFVTFQRVRDRTACAGKAGSLSRVELVDDDDQPVSVGTPGEITVRGPIVFDGYDGQAEVTDYTFRNGWHHTGDIGRFDAEGNLFYVRRKPEKELIKPGGENVYPAEVETVIVEMEAVSAVCVFGISDDKWGEAIKAVVETGSADLTAEEVRDHVGSRIARFKRPQHVEFTAALPRDGDGTIDREAVKQRWSDS